MPQPVPVDQVRPEVDRSYMVFCPDCAGWHVAEWWTAAGPARWVSVLDTRVDMPTVSHVMDVPPDPMDAEGYAKWMVLQGGTAEGTV